MHSSTASFYSYVAFIFLLKDAPVYAANKVEVVLVKSPSRIKRILSQSTLANTPRYHPVLLGAINHATGNKPPFALPAKASYGMYDMRRSAERAGVPEAQPPPDFLKRAVTVLVRTPLLSVQLRAHELIY